MIEIILHMLNWFFLIFHSVLILFNMFAWIFKKTRVYHFYLILITWFSWIVLGYFYGFAYCFLTDWHWSIREKLGYKDISYSYMHFLLLELTGINFNARIVDIIVHKGFLIISLISFFINLKEYYTKIKLK